MYTYKFYYQFGHINLVDRTAIAIITERSTTRRAMPLFLQLNKFFLMTNHELVFRGSDEKHSTSIIVTAEEKHGGMQLKCPDLASVLFNDEL